MLENNTHKIHINVDEEKDLYNSFDKFNKTVSEDVISYIMNKAEFVGITESIEIDVECKNDVNIDCFSNAYKQYIEDQMNLVKKESKLNTTKQIWLFVMGVLFITMSLVLSGIVNVIILEIISTIGSFSIWESANSWLIERKTLKIKKLKLNKLLKAKINLKNELILKNSDIM